MKDKIRILLQPKGKTAFIYKMKHGARVLDVGCGNDSAYRLKKMRPDVHYIGIDIDHQNTGNKKNSFADQLIITSPNRFHEPIEELNNSVDYVISSHNLEHCQDRKSVLEAMTLSLKSGGGMYLSFPSTQSQYFPNRYGPLNYYDEKEHTDTPPDLNVITEILKSNGCSIEFISIGYRPIILRMIGLILEPISLILKRTLIGTWQLYGFETILWIKKY